MRVDKKKELKDLPPSPPPPSHLDIEEGGKLDDIKVRRPGRRGDLEEGGGNVNVNVNKPSLQRQNRVRPPSLPGAYQVSSERSPLASSNERSPSVTPSLETDTTASSASSSETPSPLTPGGNVESSVFVPQASLVDETVLEAHLSPVPPGSLVEATRVEFYHTKSDEDESTATLEAKAAARRYRRLLILLVFVVIGGLGAALTMSLVVSRESAPSAPVPTLAPSAQGEDHLQIEELPTDDREDDDGDEDNDGMLTEIMSKRPLGFGSDTPTPSPTVKE
jgi:hypothetical protein